MEPWEFESLQPHEFYAKFEGYIWRKERREEMEAYWVHRIMACFTKKPPTPKELLKPLRPEQAKKTKAEDGAYLREKFKHRLQGGEKHGNNNR